MCTDGSEQAVAFCAQRGVSAQIGELPDKIPLAKETFDAVLLLDVLEHLDDDRAALQTAAGLLKPGGIIVATVPAYQWLWSPRDEFHHHRRRYSRADFRGLLTLPQLRVEVLSHYNMWLFPPAAAVRLARRFLPREKSQADLHVPPAPINLALHRIFGSERVLLGRVPLPFGLSLLAVARKG